MATDLFPDLSIIFDKHHPFLNNSWWGGYAQYRNCIHFKQDHLLHIIESPNGNVSFKAERDWTQEYNIDHHVSFSRDKAGAKFHLPKRILSKDIHDFMICLHAVTTYDVITLICIKLNISGTRDVSKLKTPSFLIFKGLLNKLKTYFYFIGINSQKVLIIRETFKQTAIIKWRSFL